MQNKTYAFSILILITGGISGCQTSVPVEPKLSIELDQAKLSHLSINTQISLLIPPILDSDADGILDDKDACPKTLKHTVVDDKGCPVAINLTGRLSMEVRAFFGDQSLTLRSSDSIYNELSRVAIKMSEFPQATTAVFGNISTVEAQASPQNRLAHDRAQLVKEILITQGVPANSIQTFDCGDHQQIAPNDTEEGEPFNRRVYVRMLHNDEDDYLSQKDTYYCTQF